MTDSLQHRGPDDRGVWVDDAAGVSLGHRRLSVLDLSSAARQPMQSASSRYVITFNGEIYNHLDLRRQLESNNQAASWRGHSDTETLLACIDAWGFEQTLKASTGMFALAVWDRQHNVLHLARDRMGEKPLYYGWQGNVFLFGSELKALKAHPGFAARIDRGALALLLRHNYIPAPYSIYQGIYNLSPGQWLEVSHCKRDSAPVRYWHLAEIAEAGAKDPFQGSDSQALNRLDAVLLDAVKGQMLADVPLGALLSGGIDSSLVTALMQRGSQLPVSTFTIGFEERDYDETDHARAIAKHLGTQHTELRVRGSDALALVPQLPTLYDEPFADSSQLPTHLVMKLARQHVTVALSGDGADEAFGGYNRYIHAPKVWQRTRWMPHTMRILMGKMLTSVPSGLINTVAAPVADHFGIAQAGDKMHKLGHRLHDLHSIDDLYLSLVSEWSNNKQLVGGANDLPYLLGTRENWPALHDPIARMMALDGLTYLPDDILVKVDRAAMAVSLETRAPFLDRNVIDFAWSLPMHMKIRDGQSKWLLRQLLQRHVPHDLVERPKMGFGIPLDDWLRGPLREWSEGLLAESRLRSEGYLDPVPIRKSWEAHLSGRASYGYRLWSVLMFQAWLEVNT
jgi:asparagine synthase (glutamine-hydrolysing)